MIQRMVDHRSGSLLREARQHAGLSQAELAQRARTTQSVVSAYESACPCSIASSPPPAWNSMCGYDVRIHHRAHFKDR